MVRGSVSSCSGSLIWQQLRVLPGDRSHCTSNKPWDLVPPSKNRSTETHASDLTDRALIDKCVARQSAVGREVAWEEIVRRYRRKVFGIAYKFTGRYKSLKT